MRCFSRASGLFFLFIHRPSVDKILIFLWVGSTPPRRYNRRSMAKKITLEQLDQKFDRRFEQMHQEIGSLSGDMRGLVEFVKENVAMKSEVQELRETMATRADLQELRETMATRADLQELRVELRSEILTVADQVTKLQETVEIELVAPTRRVDRLERRVTVVERKLGLAT